MNLFQRLKFALSKPPRGQIKFIVTTYIDHKISKRYYGKSLVGNFLQLLYGLFSNADSTDFPASGAPWSSLLNLKDITSTNRLCTSSTYKAVDADINQVTHGLVFGTGDTAPAAADLSLETLIANGTGAGQLSYQNQIATQGCTIVSLTTSFILQRLAVNTSGGQIDVNEIALYMQMSSYSFCIYRDVLSSADEIPNGSTYRVTLEISVTT